MNAEIDKLVDEIVGAVAHTPLDQERAGTRIAELLEEHFRGGVSDVVASVVGEVAVRLGRRANEAYAAGAAAVGVALAQQGIQAPAVAEAAAAAAATPEAQPDDMQAPAAGEDEAEPDEPDAGEPDADLAEAIQVDRLPAFSGPFRAASAVLDVSGLWLPDGTRVAVPGELVHLGQIAELAAAVQLGTEIKSGKGWPPAERGQVYVTRAAMERLWLPVDDVPEVNSLSFKEKRAEVTKDHPVLTLAREAGYQVTGKDSLDANVEVWDPENKAVQALVGFLPWMTVDVQRHILADDPAPAEIARRFDDFAKALKYPFRKSPTSTGQDLMFMTQPRADRDTLFAPIPNPEEVGNMRYLEADLNWQRPLMPAEESHEWVHAFDRGGSYLAAVRGLDFPVGAPTHVTEPFTVEGKTRWLPGYWRVTVPEPGDWRLPDITAPMGRNDMDIAGQDTWLSTPAIEFLVNDLGWSIRVHEAFLWHNKKRLLDPWAIRLRDAREQLDTATTQRSRDLLKDVYTQTLGIVDSDTHMKGKTGYAPIWYNLIKSRSRVNILRRIRQIGADADRWPVAVLKDTIVYTSDTADADAAWPGKPDNYGRGLGQFKYEGSARLEEHRQFLVGGAVEYKGKSSLEEVF